MHIKPKHIVTLAAAAGAALALSSTGGATTAGCTAGMTTYGGASARVFCGPAVANVHADGKKFSIRKGSCEKTSSYVSVNIGTVVLGATKKKQPEYFGLLVGRSLGLSGPTAGKDGTYHNGIVGVVHAGKGYALRANATVTLSKGRSHGTFRATSIDGSTVTGSFTC